MTDDPALELLSSDRPGGPDLLDDPEWAERALERWGVPPSATASAADLGELKALRSLLRRMAHSVAAGEAPAGADVAELNAQLGRTPVRAQLEVLGPGHFLVDMRPVTAGWLELALRELAGSFVALLRRSTPPRVKVCANPECRTVFLDESRNRSRRWCASTGCGNRLRVRRHRERRRAAAPG